MVNKLWYQCYPHELDESIGSRNYIQKFIDLYCPDIFDVPEDVTTDTLQIFLERVLKHYEYYHFNWNELVNLGESLTHYFFKYYEDEFPDSFFPEYPKSDRRQLALSILDYIDCIGITEVFSEDIPIIIKCLNVPDEEIVEMHDYIYNYIEQFDQFQRGIESRRRMKVLNEQRLEAIEKGKPLPIRPMGITLDPCYKRDDVDWDMIRTKGPPEFIGVTNGQASLYSENPQLLDGSFYDPEKANVKVKK